MRIETPEHMEALQKIVPLLSWGLNEIRSKTNPDLLRRLGPSTRATMLHNVVFDEAESSFTTSDGIKIGTSSGLKHFCLDDVFVRLHRAHRKKLVISTNQTGQTEEWNSRPRQMRLVGPDADYRFHLVYVPDPTWTRIDRCGVGLYFWRKPTDFIELDLEGTYGATDQPSTLLPKSQRPALKIKPREVTAPLEGLAEDGAGS